MASTINSLISATLLPPNGNFFSTDLSVHPVLATATTALLRSAMEAEMLLSKSTKLAAEIEVEVGGLSVIVAAIVLLPAFATLASSRATLEGTAPTLDLKYIKQTWVSLGLSMARDTRWISTSLMWLIFKTAIRMRRMLHLTVISSHPPIPLSHGLRRYSRIEFLMVAV